MKIDDNFVKVWAIWFRNYVGDPWAWCGSFATRKAAKERASLIKKECHEADGFEVVVRAGFMIKPKEEE